MEGKSKMPAPGSPDIASKRNGGVKKISAFLSNDEWRVIVFTDLSYPLNLVQFPK
jgi:hypothetical protein